MQGGLFGLNSTQKSYLYISQLIPALIVYFNSNLIIIFGLLQVFYILSSYLYIKYLSIQKQLYPYLFYENNKMKVQKQKGFSLAISAYLLITIYGIIFLKIGKVVIPQTVHLGQIMNSQHEYQWIVLFILLLINPICQQWFWRLYQPKTFQQQYQKNWIINITYLMFHFILFSKYLGFWRSLPLVTSFFSVGRSMSHIKNKYGFIAAIITHYGITIAGLSLYIYIQNFTHIHIVE